MSDKISVGLDLEAFFSSPGVLEAMRDARGEFLEHLLDLILEEHPDCGLTIDDLRDAEIAFPLLEGEP